jgi:glycerophosphoryl diester phosphodiesterase
MNREGTGTGKTLRLAHRGDWRRAPENTLEAFRAALAIPACDGLEFDVRAAADGVPVVCHDETLAGSRAGRSGSTRSGPMY